MSEETQTELRTTTTIEISGEVFYVARASVISFGLRDLLSSIYDRLMPVVALAYFTQYALDLIKQFAILESAVRIKRTDISFTPTCHIPIRELTLSPIQNC